MLKNLQSKINKTINIENIRKDVKTIEIQSADLGYAFVEVYPDIQKMIKHKKLALYLKSFLMIKSI